MNNLVVTASDTCRLYADIIRYECPSILFKSERPVEKNAEMYLSRPGIIIRERNCITVIELMCPFETNLLKSHDYKVTKYQNLRSALISSWYSLRFRLLVLPDLQ